MNNDNNNNTNQEFEDFIKVQNLEFLENSKVDFG